MNKRLRLRRLLAGLALGGCTALSAAQAENWIPISSGDLTIFIPQIHFKAEKTAPGAYTLSWNAQSDATSYRVEREVADETTPVDAEHILTKWQTVADLTTTSLTQVHDLTSFDLAGHQNYRLSSCNAGSCNEIGSLYYFVGQSELQNDIPANFTFTETTVSASKVGQLSAAVETNPYAYGKGYSFITGHDAPTPVQSKQAKQGLFSKTQVQSATVNPGRHDYLLQWDAVAGASRYLVSKIPDRGASPTFERLYELHADTTSFTVGLSGGTYNFVVYACSGFGFCGKASISHTESIPVPVDDDRQPKNFKVPMTTVDDQPFSLAWDEPTITTDLLEYEVFGELAGLIGTVDVNADPLTLERNNAVKLAAGRQYCYKVRGKYATFNGPFAIPVAPDPHCIKAGGEPILPAPESLTLVGDIINTDIPTDDPYETSRYWQIQLNNSYMVNWSAVPGADYYQLDRELVPGTGQWSPVYVGTARQLSQRFVTGGFQMFRVSACKNNGYCGNYQRLHFDANANMSDTLISRYKQPACLNVPATVGVGETVNVSWCAPLWEGVDRYELVDGNGLPVDSGVPATFDTTQQALLLSDQGVKSQGTHYCYAIKAYFPGDATAYELPPQCGDVIAKASPATISPFGGNIDSDTVLSVSSTTSGATIWYASVAAGTSCHTSSNWTTYAGTFSLSESGKICAKVVKSGLDDSDITSATFNIINRPPQIMSTSPAVASAGRTFSYQLWAKDPDNSNSELTFTLPTGPQGMAISSTGLISWSPTTANIGSHAVIARVSDGGNNVEQAFTLTVKALPPIAAVDISNLNAQSDSFRVNWQFNQSADVITVAEEFNGVWGIEQQWVTSNTYLDYNGKLPGRYRYRVGTCSGGVCGNHKVSAAFTLSDFSASNVVSDSTSINGLSSDVGITAGEFRVSESGAATYIVPLNLPAGVAGTKPAIALSYTNQGGDGVMGRGWALNSGAGAVTRCARNIYQNGDIAAVSYDDNDVFCLDGQQLKLADGTYGADGATYHKIIDDFAIITSHGTAADSGPEHFTVKTKAGDTYYYGYIAASSEGADAFVEPNRPGGNNDVAKYWALTKVVDANGNAIRYNYTEVTATGVHLLESVEYGANEGVSTARDFAKVSFGYVNNLKPKVGYSGGSQVMMDKLLANISITVDDISYRYYDFAYDTSNAIEERNYLTEVKECIALDSQCLGAMNFTWQRPPAASTATRIETNCEPLPNGGEFCEDFEVPNSTSFTPFATVTNLTALNGDADRYTSHLLDINADGYSDVVYEDNGWQVLFGPDFSGSPRFLSNIGSSDEDRSYAMNIDYDGDGKQELLVANSNGSSTNGNWWVLAYRNGAVKAVNLGRTAFGYLGAAQVMDINGDGLQDIVYQNGNNIEAYRNNGWVDGPFDGIKVLHTFTSETELTFNYQHVSHSPRMKNSAAIDINGDGRSDLLTKVKTTSGYCEGYPQFTQAGDCHEFGHVWKSTSSTNWRLYVSDGNINVPHLTELTSISYSGDDLRVTDLNGDGLTDVIYRLDSNDRWYYVLSTGIGFGAPHQTVHTSPDNVKDDIFFVDLNGDGRADILKPVTSSKWDVMMSVPTTTSDRVTWQKRGEVTRNADDSTFFGDVDGDGKLDLVMADNDNWTVKKAIRANIIDHVITDFTNGWGVKTTVTYESMLDNSVVISNVVPETIIDTFSPLGPMTVVKKVESDSHTDGSRLSVSYRYGGMLLHREGLGALGFRQLETTDAQSQVVTTTTFKQSFPYTGMPLTTVQTVGSDTLSSATNVLGQLVTSGNGGRFVFIDEVTEIQNQIGTDGSPRLLSNTVTDNDYDKWGNLTTSSVNIMGGSSSLHSTDITNSYGAADSFSQINGRMLSSNVTKKINGNSGAITRSSVFTYYTGSETCEGSMQTAGMLQSSTINGLSVTTCYDDFGHKVKITKTGKLNDGDSGTTSIDAFSVYSTDGRVLSSNTNHSGHVTNYHYNDGVATGTVNGLITSSSVIDSNNVEVTTHIDAWGKTIAIVSPLAATKTIKTVYCDSCTANSKFYVEVRQKGSPTKRSIFDKFSREVATKVAHFDTGKYSYTFNDYDAQGRLLRKYLPTLQASRPTAASAYTEYSYDNYSRLISTKMPNSAASGYVAPTTTFAGLVTTKTDAKGNALIETRSLRGQLTKVEDELAGTLSYSYDAYGNLKTVHKAVVGKSILQLTNTYNSYGEKTKIIDNDQGSWDYRYNAFNRLVWQKDGNNNAITTEYDTGGRQVRKYGYDFTQCWIYGDANSLNSTDKLVATRYYDGVSAQSCTASGYTQGSTMAYDAAGRVYHTTETVADLVHSLNGEYHSFQQFDTNGRLFKQRYPGLGLTIEHQYQNGYSYKLINADTNTIYQHITAMNAAGQVTGVTYANGTTEVAGFDGQTGLPSSHSVSNGSTLHSLGYGYDTNGNLTSRSHAFGSLSQNANYSEIYGYDELNRLTDRTVSVASQGNLPGSYTMNESYDYDGFGNFTSKDNTGYYEYDDNKRLTGIYSDPGFTSAALYDFDYDNNGNIVSDGDRGIMYASFNKAVLINKGSASTAFTYGMGHKRYYRHDQRLSAGALVNTHTAYIGGLEKTYRATDGDSNDLIEYKFTVGNVVITERSSAVNNSSTDESYLHKDHLGSPLTITDKDGVIVQQNVYDPWGKVHQLYQSNAIGSHLLPTRRGYTGHEGVEGLDIIHMNGRIYDASIGRFLQADPNIQAAKNSQSYNRYAYVINNPLTLTDPSGFFFSGLKKFIKKYWRQIAVIVISIYLPGAGGLLEGWGITNVVAQGAITGFVSGAVSTGSLKGALSGAFTGAMFGGLHSMGAGYGKIIAHGIVGGIGSSLNGGKFGHGFFAAGFTQAASMNGKTFIKGDRVGNALKAAAIGGTASAVSGGKFANGAVTGVFSRLLNDDGWDLNDLDDRLSAEEFPEASEIVSAEVAVTEEADINGTSETFTGTKYSTKDGVTLVNPSTSVVVSIPGSAVGMDLSTELDLQTGEFINKSGMVAEAGAGTAQTLKIGVQLKTDVIETSVGAKGCLGGTCIAPAIVVDVNPIFRHVARLNNIVERYIIEMYTPKDF